MPVLYADIIVDISAGNLDRVFQYRIPSHLNGIADIGSQVMIPFGKSNRMIRGFIVNMTSRPDYDESKIKDIDQVINNELAMESQLIRLAWQIRKVYGGTMNQALKTVIPVKRQVKAQVSRYYSLTQDEGMLDAYEKRLGSDRRYKTRMELIRRLKTEGPFSREELLNVCHVSPSVVKALVSDGILVENVTRQYRRPMGQLMDTGQPVVLSPAQSQVVREICEDEQHRIHLIHGITGSGKTEIYMELIAEVVARGRQAIVLIPEISLSLQTVSRFYRRFGDRVSVMNSRLSDGEKYDQYLRAKRGEVDIVVGPRSALFMPFEHLGMIIIDEEHDGAYKSENTPRFHARDVAAWRARMSGAKLILGSATPSLESYARALAGMYALHTLNVRARAGSILPNVSVVDLREEFRQNNKKIFSRKLRALMEDALKRGEQIILFLNRRGYAGFVSCRSCGHVFKCRHCEVSMTAHRGGRLKCHYCGYEEPLPRTCPECGSPYVAAFGMGTQKVEGMIADEFPQARVLRLDRDSTSRKDSMDDILNRFRRHEADILVGTQMIVKGHDFPDVTVVGILAADLSMFSNDYMAAERTFQLLTQAAGRCGRDEKPGQVVIQTYSPEHYSIRCAASQDYGTFYRQEMSYRRLLSYPPVVHMLAVLAVGADEGRVQACITALAGAVRDFCREQGFEDMVIVGPADASVSKGKDVYRKVFYVKNKKYPWLIAAREFMEQHLRASPFSRDVSLQFDMDPMSMY